MDDEALSRQAAALSADPASNMAATNSRDFFVRLTGLHLTFDACQADSAQRWIVDEFIRLERLYKVIREASNGQANRN